jgi:hypothetical protein
MNASASGAELPLHLFERCRQGADRHGILFHYNGYFSQNIVAALGAALRQRLERLDASQGARRRLFSVFVELTQNVVHYSADALTAESAAEHEVRRGALWVGGSDGRYVVVCANPVQRSRQPRVRERLEALRHMSLEDIKAHYTAQRRNGSPADDSKGAGLGFLTVARDASGPIEYDFVDNGDAGHIMLYLKATIRS